MKFQRSSFSIYNLYFGVRCKCLGANISTSSIAIDSVKIKTVVRFYLRRHLLVGEFDLYPSFDPEKLRAALTKGAWENHPSLRIHPKPNAQMTFLFSIPFFQVRRAEEVFFQRSGHDGSFNARLQQPHRRGVYGGLVLLSRR